MRNAIRVSVAVLVITLGSSCGKKVEPPPAAPSYGAETNEDAIAVKVGCARCLHQMAGVTECTPAIRVGERKPILADGMAIPPAGEASICEVEREAKVVGDMEGGVFYALDIYYLPVSP